MGAVVRMQVLHPRHDVPEYLLGVPLADPHRLPHLLALLVPLLPAPALVDEAEQVPVLRVFHDDVHPGARHAQVQQLDLCHGGDL